MQTSFSLAALADPAMAASEKILRTCVHCGFCTATCPTYLELGDELDSPRGRIYLIKKMFEAGEPANAEVVQHIDRCLSCLSCMTTCPSGVHYMHLVDHARAHIERSYRRPWHQRLMRGLLANLLPYPNRFRLAIFASVLARPFRGVVERLPVIGAQLGAMLALAPARIPTRSAMEGPGRFPARGPRRARVALLSGCAQPVLAPQINEATIRVLNRLGIEVVLPEGAGCCGALVHHMGHEETSHRQAARLIDAWMAEIEAAEREGASLDAILITASGCGTTIKDYGFMFRNDPAYAAKAARVSALAKDITEYLATLDLAPARETGLTIAYHSACSMQHGQKITEPPKAILRALGFRVKDVPEGHICCGSAGTYNMLQPEISGRLRQRKAGNIVRTRPDAVATGNLGCISQIGLGLSERGEAVPVIHTIELVDWALGGAAPAGLRMP
ncbi:glycolate oxidase subunit GlcF [Rhabdaerophilum calidifontis]|uniref:glycolate oxidase subunit GlcF n=1 Tax=Rhabdaerophilum calidifontis TaxID=2604328 RepID=UPI00123A97F8|nr:glycolate oxidase subunit GlcF [Rhabdaerophilum calidifontis]